MTDRGDTRAQAPARAARTAPARRRPRLIVTAMAALAGFFVIFQLLAFQLRSGGDPALGAGQPVASVRPAVAHGRAPASASSTIVTRASGASSVTTRVASPVSPSAAPATLTTHRTHRATGSVVTRASGGGSKNPRHSGEREDGSEA